MPNYLNIIQKKLSSPIETLVDDYRANKDKSFFKPTGTQIYSGPQGSGKTASAVAHLLQIKKLYPSAIIVSNLLLTGKKQRTVSLKTVVEHYSLCPSDLSAENIHRYMTKYVLHILQNIDPQNEYIHFNDFNELSICLTSVNNGKKGVIYLIDEIHTYLNALDSKNIPMYIFTEISQQRKQRKLIIGTSQLFLRVAKPLREQCDNIIVCNTYFNIITTQRAYDAQTLDVDNNGKLVGNLKKRGFFIQTRNLRNSYDTFQKVVSGSEQFENSNLTLSISKKDKKLFNIK